MLARMSSAVLVQRNGFGSALVAVDVGVDGLFQLGDGAEHTTPQGALGEQGEEALDLIDP